MRFSPALLLFATLGLPALGCAHKGPPPIEVPTAPPQVASIDDFEPALNRYVLLPQDHPARAEHRLILANFLVEYLQGALDEDNEDEAEAALRYSLSLYTPAELRTTGPHNGLATSAHRVYQRTARRGAEAPSLLALAVEQRFGDDTVRTRAVRDWRALEHWLVSNGPFATEPLLAHEDLERGLEKVAAVFPSPFVVQRLADLYTARYEAAVEAHANGRGLGNTSARRIEITGYLLMRLYLRADDPEGAVEAMGRVKGADTIDKLRDIVEDAFKNRRSARALLSLAEQFIPEDDADPAAPYVAQSWGIIDNVTRRALDRYPRDPFVHLLRARRMREEGLVGAAVHHLQRSIELKDDVFEAWQMLAELSQLQLSQLSRRDADAALERLGEVESLHQRAMKLWSDRPIRPALPEAYFTVAEGLYQSGRVDDAEGLLDKGLAIEAQPQTLDLLGTIALKRGRFAVAQSHYEELARLPFDDARAQLRWEARARGQLGEIALRRGDSKAGSEHLRVALRQINDLLGQPAMTAEVQADRYLERGRLLFLLGEVGLAVDDFGQAAELTPGYVKAYAEPMLLLVSYGYYIEARSVFATAVEQTELSDGLKLYFSLWVNDLALRQGQPPDSRAEGFLASYQDGGWGYALARHARGELDYEQLRSGASDEGERAEASFYEGLRRWRTGDPESGKALLKQVVDSNLMGFFEYDMAQAYLAWDELPVTARMPMLGGVARRRLPADATP